MARLVKQTKAQVKAYVREHGHWNGYMLGCNLYPGAYGSMGFRIKLAWHETRGVVDAENEVCEPAPTPDCPWNHGFFPRTFQALIDNWSYYNSCNETGYYPAFYHSVK